jgi:hypothetical protein
MRCQWKAKPMDNMMQLRFVPLNALRRQQERREESIKVPHARPAAKIELSSKRRTVINLL